MVKILCWNVAGIRACIKKGALDFLEDGEYDIICFQETKAEEHQVNVPNKLAEHYPYRYWRSTQGITQRKGLSGTAIWSKLKPIKDIDPPAIDAEGRVTTLEFPNWNLVTVYTPNSQGPTSERHIYRVGVWDEHFRDYVKNLEENKPTIICGDFNVGKEDIDVYKPDEWRNKCAGFLDDERENFNLLLDEGWIDTFRLFNLNKPNCYTYWDQKLPYLRKTNRGWRIDYFLVPSKLETKIVNSKIHPEIMGSDHCPISLEIRKRKFNVIKSTQ
jgi:exodeoxyribonuclease-3